MPNLVVMARLETLSAVLNSPEGYLFNECLNEANEPPWRPVAEQQW
jgi:hypothetical protein